ncbi:hypothetical protein K437DRAFT_63170 [Tilletiaria anomala UBC 951]|uniref:Uncharacterized protein n=1 Tax=Tilletiaria anomala (strain ATCC 24038 / CBS 436.72 / UBC 951) TaxID=1037660 RepID=A0A066V3P2_TILAU|nr:uncharacterized protein K437DRAFT_63170 [Tilletiaria anomala UBC 951]KDN36091.1 hypothetical protein K437DRAFT_63170 [Tilletiaria anomala UBC 951]
MALAPDDTVTCMAVWVALSSLYYTDPCLENDTFGVRVNKPATTLTRRGVSENRKLPLDPSRPISHIAIPYNFCQNVYSLCYPCLKLNVFMRGTTTEKIPRQQDGFAIMGWSTWLCDIKMVMATYLFDCKRAGIHFSQCQYFCEEFPCSDCIQTRAATRIRITSSPTPKGLFECGLGTPVDLLDTECTKPV